MIRSTLHPLWAFAIPATMRMAFALAMVVLGAECALATDPDVRRVSPPGAQQGSEISLEFNGRRLGDAEEILWYDPGFSVKEWTVREDRRAVAIVEVSPECKVGEHFLRLRTRTGLSYAHTLWVGRFPTVDEIEPNNTVATATPASLQTTIHGIINFGDVDHISVEAKAGQRLSVEIEALRLGRGLVDPYLSILDPDGVPLAASDDTPLLTQDTFTQILAPRDGLYTIRVRDAARAGAPDADYRLHVGTFPRPAAVYPTGARPGQTLNVTFLGDIAGPFTEEVTIPKSPGFPFGLFPEQDGVAAPSWNPFRGVNMVAAMDAEPNNDRESATPTPKGVRGICGILNEPGDQDWYRFTPTKGQQIRVRMMASFVGSAVDALLWIYGPDGKQIGFADDSGGPDGTVEFTPSKEGEHLIRVGEHLGQGGQQHTYRVEISQVRPSMSITLPRFGRDSQARQVILVPRGGRFATSLVANRGRWSGDIKLDSPKLPDGVTMTGEIIQPDMRSRVVVFQAADDAPLAGQLTPLVARSDNPELSVRANLYQRVELVIGPPNRTVFYRKNLTKLPVAVVESLPFSVDIEPVTTPLLRTGVAKLKIRATRAEGFVAPITVRMLLKPPGVSAPSTVTLPEGATEIDYPIDANSGARLGEIDLAVLGEATVGGATAFASSQLCRITIAEPFVDGTIAMTAIPQKNEGEIRLTVNHKRPLPADATLQLLNLPYDVTSAPITVKAGESNAVFRVTVGPKAKRGKHRNLFCEVTIPDGEQVMVQRIAHKGVLRVDPPKPKSKAITKSAPPPPSKENNGPAEKGGAPKETAKPLSRLEILRREAAERAAAQAQAQAQARANGPSSNSDEAGPSRPSTTNESTTGSKEERR